MVSDDCGTVLVMESTGDLVVYSESANPRRRRLSGRPSGWYIGWSSNTSIVDQYGTSQVLFTLNPDGKLQILEYPDGIDGDEGAMELWSVSGAVNGSAFTFDLTTAGCLEMDMVGDDGESEVVWTECSEFVIPSTTSSTSSTTTTEDVIDGPGSGTGSGSDAASGRSATDSDDLDARFVVIYILISVLIVVVCCMCIGGGVYLKRNKKENDRKVEMLQIEAVSPSAVSAGSVESVDFEGDGTQIHMILPSVSAVSDEGVGANMGTVTGTNTGGKFVD